MHRGPEALNEARRLLDAGARADTGQLLRQLALFRCGAAPLPVVSAGAPLFSELGPRAFESLANVLEVCVAPTGFEVVTEGAPAGSLFGVAHGRLDVVRMHEGNVRKVVAEVGAEDIFGEIGLIAGTPRLASVVATVPCVLLELTRAGLEAITLKHAALPATMQGFYQSRLLANVLRTSPLFTGLPEAQRLEVTKAFQARTAVPGDILRRAGDTGDGLYLLVRGQCTPFLPDTGAGRITYAPMREGEVFGELSLLLGKPVSVSIRVDTPSTLLWLPREAFDRLLQRNPGWRAELMKMGFERLQRAARLMSGRLAHLSDTRV